MVIFNGLIDFVARVLAFFYSLPVVGGSYGIAIILLTFAVMVLLMPLTLKATRSTIKMQQVQPELRRLQKKHKNDRETMNAELMKLYSENGINPIGGCLPMLAQLPFFFVLFRILSGLTQRAEDTPFYALASVIRTDVRGLPAQDGRLFSPQYLDIQSDLYQDLHRSTEMNFGPFDLAERALDVLRDNFVTAIPYVLLIIFVVASSYYQQRQVSARRSPSDADMSPMMQQQQMLLKILPLMSGVWSFLFPAGLVLYWATSNLFRIGQQSYITHQIYGKEAAALEAEAALRPKKVVEDDDDEEPAPKPKKTKPPRIEQSSVTGEPAATNGATKDRSAQWQELRAQKARVKSKQHSKQPPSRVTPKGTQSGQAKKKKR